MVRKGDPARSVADLEGADIAWVDPDSLTGFRAPRAAFREMGLDPDRYFGRATFTHAHDRAVEAVRSGLVQVAAVDEELLAAEPAPHELRVVWRSQAFPSPPFLVSRDRPDLLGPLEDIAARPECLSALGAEGLTASHWALYDPLGEIIEKGH